MRKTPPRVVVSSDELNDHLRNADDNGGRASPMPLQGRAGFVALHQLRTVDVERLATPLENLKAKLFSAVDRRSQNFGQSSGH